TAILLLLLVPLSSVFAYPAWDGNFHPYAVGDLVTYNGRDYRCQQAHTSQPDWNPVATPALWVDLGPTGGTTAPTSTRTNTPVGPTATRTNTPVGPTPTRTNTSVGPTATRTNTAVPATPTRTNTPCGNCGGGLPKHVITGYWQNFNNGALVLKLR